MLSSGVINSNQNSLNKAVKPIYYGLLLLGIILRLIPYFLNRSLFLDEASVALNVTDRDFKGLIHPLDYNQVAPVLFLFIEKVNITLFGNSEYSLRLFPLLCGLLSLSLVYRFTKAISGNTIAALVALFLFATSTVLIDYSSQVKQYESDVFCALCLLTLAFDSTCYNESKKYMLLTVVGSVLIFLSNVAILVMFTVGVYYVFKYRLTISRQRWLLAMFALWIIAFLVNYYFFIYHHPTRTFMLMYWQNDFMPSQVFTSGFWQWLYLKFLSLFKFYSLPFVAVFILSIIIFIIKKQRLYLFLLLFPVLLHLFISEFKLYPFETRLILYLIVFITPSLAIGLFELVQLLKKRITIYPIAILLIILVYSIVAQLVNNHYPFYKEEIKKSIAFINSNKINGQKVYVYYGSARAVNYYLRNGWGWLNPEVCYNDLKKLNGTYWLLFSHVLTGYGNDETKAIESLTKSNSTILKSFKTTGSSAYLVKIKPVL